MCARVPCGAAAAHHLLQEVVARVALALLHDPLRTAEELRLAGLKGVGREAGEEEREHMDLRLIEPQPVSTSDQLLPRDDRALALELARPAVTLPSPIGTEPGIEPADWEAEHEPADWEAEHDALRRRSEPEEQEAQRLQDLLDACNAEDAERLLLTYSS